MNIDLKKVIDGFFAFLEKTYGAGHPMVNGILVMLQTVVDTAGMSALEQFLKDNGYLS